MSTTFFSDLLRVALLGTYGGIWMDASIFLSAQIPNSILNAEFFAFQRSIMPPKDAKIWSKFNGGYFVWDEKFRVRLFSAFLRATPKHPIILALSDILLSYWEREMRLVHYYALHIIFDLLIKTPKFTPLNCEITNDTDIHLLLLHANEPFNETLWAQISRKSPIHKLDRRLKIESNSMLERILNA